MRSIFTALLAGLLFGSGLVISGMTNPENILAFLDVTGNWNPALALVMASAIVVTLPAFTWVRRRQHNLVGDPVTLSNRRPLDKDLIFGAIIFGVGWGLSGLCPAPSLIAGLGGNAHILVFVLTMTIGLWLSTRFKNS
ncbi:DUF6691 family protein [Aquirhabdus parva]|uniref:YeeE/YedE family protein n=1 Tax=Aquirhabdus parva TaxID=2283318 RepID=A0A345P6P1_9GAMM|nr:DUF6691 family protein [Aquirhabdus parva]AXI02950.1 YeeE/YedE family protein [Aquirhabdus parva]